MRKEGDLEVAVVAVVNALGNVYDPSNGEKIAFTPSRGYPVFCNTTISCVLTNAIMTKAQANKLADATQDSYARCIRPVHTAFDGDSIFLLASGEVKADLLAVQMLADEACCEAIIKAVRSW